MLMNVILVAAFSPLVQSGDGLRFPQPLVDLGELTSHQVRTHAFPFVNDGAAAVEILAVEPSCGCMAPRLEGHLLQPGKKGNLILEVKPMSQPAGPHSWFAKVRYRQDGQVFETGIRITASIRHEVNLEPTVIGLFGSALKQEVVLTDRRKTPLTVTRVSFSSPLGQARIVSAGGGVTRILLETAAVPPGRHSEMLSLFTDDPTYAHFQMPVTLIGQTRSKITVLPEKVVVRIEPGRPTPSTLVRLRNTSDGPLVLAEVKSDDPAILCTWAQGPGNDATVRILIDAGKLGKRRLDSFVRIQVRSPAEEIMTIPVQAVPVE